MESTWNTHCDVFFENLLWRPLETYPQHYSFSKESSTTPDLSCHYYAHLLGNVRVQLACSQEIVVLNSLLFAANICRLRLILRSAVSVNDAQCVPLFVYLKLSLHEAKEKFRKCLWNRKKFRSLIFWQVLLMMLTRWNHWHKWGELHRWRSENCGLTCSKGLWWETLFSV